MQPAPTTTRWVWVIFPLPSGGPEGPCKEGLMVFGVCREPQALPGVPWQPRVPPPPHPQWDTAALDRFARPQKRAEIAPNSTGSQWVGKMRLASFPFGEKRLLITSMRRRQLFVSMQSPRLTPKDENHLRAVCTVPPIAPHLCKCWTSSVIAIKKEFLKPQKS